MEQTGNNVVFLEGKKTILRALDPRTDADAVTRWINDPKTRVFLNNSFPRGYQDELEWVTKQSKHDPFNIVLGIVAKPDNTLIGTMGLHGISYTNGVATTGALIGEHQFLNQGYGQDAKMQLLNHAFLTLGLRKICSSVKAFNGRSLAYNKACGYKEEGRRKQQYFVNGEYVDEVLLAVFFEDWLPLWQAYNEP